LLLYLDFLCGNFTLLVMVEIESEKGCSFCCVCYELQPQTHANFMARCMYLIARKHKVESKKL
jgi:hypothetical protein